MTSRTHSRRVARDHQFLIVDDAGSRYVFHNGDAITSRPIRARTFTRVLAFYEDYLGWPVYRTQEEADMETPAYSSHTWRQALRDIQADPAANVHANTLNALLKRGYIHVGPRGGLGLTPDGEAYLAVHSADPLPEMLRFPAVDDRPPADFASPVAENGHSQAAAIPAGVDKLLARMRTENLRRAANHLE